MCPIPGQWDYLIVTASNDRQAAAYQNQLDLRQKLGLLSDVGQVMVMADLDGKRIGSGGSTIYCLIELLNRELAPAPPLADKGSVGAESAYSTSCSGHGKPNTCYITAVR